jgi:hypothetical protein
MQITVKIELDETDAIRIKCADELRVEQLRANEENDFDTYDIHYVRIQDLLNEVFSDSEKAGRLYDCTINNGESFSWNIAERADYIVGVN